MLLPLLLAQAAPTIPPTAPTKFSILQPVANEPCVPPGPKAQPDDIVVCGKPLPSQTLPYPNEVVPDSPRPSNPDLRATGSLALESTPCAARSGGCGTGIDIFGGGTMLVRLVQKAVSPDSCCEEPGEATNPVALVKDAIHGLGRAVGRKPDTSNRVAIPLDDAPVSTAGKILP